MQKEIERKWLVLKENLPTNLEQYKYALIEQAYILKQPVLRIRKEDENYYLTYKNNVVEHGTIDLVERIENTFEINKEEYNRLLLAAKGIILYKKRYFIPYGKYVIELDVFAKDYEGLIYAEVEFNNKEEAFNFLQPSWFSRELTYDLQCTNVALAKIT